MSLPRPLTRPEKRLLRAIAALTKPATIYRPAENIYRCGLSGTGARTSVWFELEKLGLIRIDRVPGMGPIGVEATAEGLSLDAARPRRSA